MTDGLTLGIFALWDQIPFGVDGWPMCGQWERAGRLTLFDQMELDAAAAAVRLDMALELDRRFDALDDWLEEQMAPRLGVE